MDDSAVSKDFGAKGVGVAVASLGGVFMLDPATIATGESLGLDLAAFYGLGRAGVLGDAPASVVHATMFFFHQDMVVAAWDRARKVMDPATAVTHYAKACQDWGRAHLEGLSGLARICELGERVIAAADPSGRTLFAGWASVPLPDDLAGRGAQVLHVLREARGGFHIPAVMASGLSPLEALVVHDGVDAAAMFGWPGPYPDPAGLTAAHTRAESLTDEMATRDLAVLDADERREFATLLTDLLASLSG